MEALRELVGKKKLESVDMAGELKSLGLDVLFPLQNWPSLLAVQVSDILVYLHSLLLWVR